MAYLASLRNFLVTIAVQSAKVLQRKMSANDSVCHDAHWRQERKHLRQCQRDEEHQDAQSAISPLTISRHAHAGDDDHHKPKHNLHTVDYQINLQVPPATQLGDVGGEKLIADDDDSLDTHHNR